MSLINIEKTIELDVYDHDTTPSVIKTIQMDTGTRTVFAVIQNSRQDYDIGQNASVSLTVLRPDKTKVQVTGQTFVCYTGTDGTMYGAKAELSDVALAVKGNLKAQFKITSGEQELRTEIFTINNGEALDAGDGDWAGDLDGHNLDEMAESIEALQTDVAAAKEDLDDLRDHAFPSTAKVLLISLLKNAVYTSDMTDMIDALDTALNIGDIIAVTGISLDASAKSVTAGGTTTITATVTPSNATNKGIVWTSSDETVATVNGGIVTGVGNGTAVITAKTVDGGFTATCSVTSTIVNLLDRSKSSIGYYVNRDNGQIVSSDTFDATDFIWLEPNTTYYSEGCYLKNFYAFYNANKVYVSSPPASVTITSEPDRNWGADRKGTIVTGSQGYYFRCSYNKSVAYTPYIALAPIE